MTQQTALTAIWSAHPGHVVGGHVRYALGEVTRTFDLLGADGVRLLEEFLALDLELLVVRARSHDKNHQVDALAKLGAFFSRWGPFRFAEEEGPAQFAGARQYGLVQDELAELIALHRNISAAFAWFQQQAIDRKVGKKLAPPSAQITANTTSNFVGTCLAGLRIGVVTVNGTQRLGIGAHGLSSFICLALSNSFLAPRLSPGHEIVACIECKQPMAAVGRAVYCSKRCGNRVRQRRFRAKSVRSKLGTSKSLETVSEESVHLRANGQPGSASDR